MEKEFIPYEEAKLMKVIGFDNIMCFGYYAMNRLWNGSYDNSQNNKILCPTFSQSFRWFRDFHNIEYAVLKFDDSIGYGVVIKTNYPIVNNENKTVFLTYEEAELALAVRKFIRKGDDKSFQELAGEIADVEIMIEQMKIMEESLEIAVGEIKLQKLTRLEQRLNDNSFE